VLIVVLGLVALVASWASAAVYEDMLEIRRAQDMQDGAQAWLGSESVMRLACKLLADDARHSRRDDLHEAWAQHLPPFPVDGGTLAGVIVDENRYFNLNDLVDDKGVAQAGAVATARRLFALAGVDDALVDVLVDWMDADDRPSGASGAEDASYADKPYRVKNARLDRWGELRLLKGFDAQVIQALSRVAMVGPVPNTGITPININTAPKPVLLALFPKLNEAGAEALIAARPYSALATLTRQPWAQGGDVAHLDVSSHLFVVHTDVRFGRARMREAYGLMRQGTQITLLWRSRRFAGLGG
jgi:general secretion pathway protein K